MIKHNQDGAAGLLVSLILSLILLVAVIVFGAWAFNSRQDYKNHTDAKVAVAVGQAKQQEDVKKAADYAEAAKNPLKTYNGPEAYGSLIVNYPKTWSGYVDDTGQGSALVDGYFAPGVVPSTNNQNSVFALRVQVVSQSYSQVLQSFSGQEQGGKLTAAAYALPKVPSVVGVKVNGQLNNQTSTTMVVLPLRSQTLEISTQGAVYLNDFNNYILPNFSFSP
ncbi:MAG TPA: hypothetical protein VH234_04995 [Candidatus Saccharimonadales bacterium]|jgi:preprotein translocase subunit SecF|nr:hypothetical protein [Candidatus Saccharimonadales bacterium]